ncbi:MAG: FAD-dependent thymidylate synthase [Planctomycetota bacterium]|jgi:thymidylate synthase ThyX
MAYTDKERQLLSQYFSVLEPREHGDIYRVRNLPQEVAATLNGIYSRSHKSMRDNFLDRLKKGLGEAGKSFEEEEVELPAPVEDVLTGVMASRAGKFLKTYAIDHGHNSLREGSIVHLAVENVSQLVTRFIQRERRCSFEESSTRYISFSAAGHWRDPDVMDAGGPAAAAYEEILHTTFSLYREMSDHLLAWLREVRPLGKGEKEGPWLRTLKAEAFDSARYLLTPAIYTKWGMVADARTLSDILTELLSHPLAEFRLVGERMKAQAEIALPTLLAHARPNEFLAAQDEALPGMASRLGSTERVRGEAEPGIDLISHDQDLDAKLLASLIYEQSPQPYSALLHKTRAMRAGERLALLERVLMARGKHDALPMAMEGAQPFDFEILVDFGAYRDIGRHRKGFQQQQLLTTAHGYLVPPLIKEAGLDAPYREVLDHAQGLQEVVAREHPRAAGYVTPFAFLQRVRIIFDPRQVAYFIELRSGPEGHFAYRQSALDLYREVQRVSPLFAEFIRAKEGKSFLGRMDAEQTADEKRQRRMMNAGDL